VTAGGGPRLVEQVHPGLAAALGTLWVAVTRAGGAVGFVPDSPESDIRAAAEQVVADVVAGHEQMIVIGTGQELVGTVFLRLGRGSVIAHRADLVRLMVHPDDQRGGRGKTLLDAAAARAREIGLEQLLLSARGGTTLPGYYRARGWTPVGVWPGALRLGPDDVRDEHWFQLRLG
jgi:acetyltransferase